MSELLDYGETVREFGARIQIIEPELIYIQETSDIGILDGQSIPFSITVTSCLTSWPLPLNLSRSFAILLNLGRPACDNNLMPSGHFTTSESVE